MAKKASKTGGKGGGRRSGVPAAHAPEPPKTEAEQSALYDQAIEHFHDRSFEEAAKFLTLVQEGPDVALRHNARVHLRICQRHFGSDTVEVKTLEDRYNLAVKLINDRALDQAEDQLDAVLKAAPDAAHAHYARAAVAALRQDPDKAYESLRQAVTLDPQNRVLAKRDTDLAGVIADRRIAELLQSADGKTS